MTRFIRLIAALPLALLAASATAAPGPGPAPYRALGTEPFWSLEIDGDRLTLKRPDHKPLIVRAEERSTVIGRRYDAPAMRVDVRAMWCSDGMSDNHYPDTVRVVIGHSVLKGCGGTPVQPLALAGSSWRVVEIGGRAVKFDRVPTLRFAGDRVTGSTGCNGYGAAYRLNGDRLTISTMISTKMACIGLPGNVERQFRGITAAPMKARIERDRLVLTGANGGRIVAVRAD